MSTGRLIAGLGVGLVAVGLAAGVAFSGRRATAAGAGQGGAPAAPSRGVPGPALGSTGQVVQVGMVNAIPAAQGYSTGPYSTTHNPAGWDYAWLGGK